MKTIAELRHARRLIDLAGATPLVQLSRVAAEVRPLVLAKLEYLNPGGSVKDRIALRMVEAAEQAGRLRPGGTIVEPTSGNTGVGLAIVGQHKGYRCIFTCPDKVSTDKRNVLRALGAEVVVCPSTVLPEHPDSYRSVAQRLSAEHPGACLLDQYTNEENPRAHYLGTGPEIWDQTDGQISCLVAGIGTGGTITGTGRFLKEASHGRVRVIGADPDGSVYSGATAPKPYLVEGVGQPSLPAVFDPTVPDEFIAVTDRESFAMTRRLAREEALLVGPSGGMAVAAALRASARLSEKDIVVVVLPDSGRGYLSKVYDDEWMSRHGFALTGDEPADDVAVQQLAPSVPHLLAHHTIAEAATLMARHALPALPVLSAPPPARVAQIIGAVTDASLAEALTHKPLPTSIKAFIGPPMPSVGSGQSIEDAAAALVACGATTVLDGGVLCWVLNRHDLLAAAYAGAGPLRVVDLAARSGRIRLQAERGAE